MKKFGITMEQNSKTIPEWIEEVIEEQIDSISYLSTLKDRIVKKQEEILKELDISRDNEQILQLQLDQALKNKCKCPDTNGKKEKK